MSGDITESRAEARAAKAMLLGPFLGHVTTGSVKIWLHLQGEHDTIYVTIHPSANAGSIASGRMVLRRERLFTDCITISGLEPNTRYFYRLWTNEACTVPLDLQGLTENELRFRTLSDKDNEQVDFLMMSCHNPTVAQEDGFDGHAVWADIPQIISRESNENVRFALLVGDQVYADDWQDRILAERNDEARLQLYLDVYRTFWSNIHYRRVLCALPAMMMWDDHDITDGWGSTLDSFVGTSSQFTPEWQGLFKSASAAFSIMQSSRNPHHYRKLPVRDSTAVSELGSGASCYSTCGRTEICDSAG